MYFPVVNTVLSHQVYKKHFCQAVGLGCCLWDEIIGTNLEIAGWLFETPVDTKRGQRLSNDAIYIMFDAILCKMCPWHRSSNMPSAKRHLFYPWGIVVFYNVYLFKYKETYDICLSKDTGIASARVISFEVSYVSWFCFYLLILSTPHSSLYLPVLQWTPTIKYQVLSYLYFIDLAQFLKTT